MKNDYLISAKEFRKLLGGISDSTLWRLTKRGELPPAIKLGDKRYYRRSWADEIIETGRWSGN